MIPSRRGYTHIHYLLVSRVEPKMMMGDSMHEVRDERPAESDVQKSVQVMIQLKHDREDKITR